MMIHPSYDVMIVQPIKPVQQDYFTWVVYRLDPVSVHNVRADSKECCLLPKYRLLQVFTSDKIVYVFLQNNSNTLMMTHPGYDVMIVQPIKPVQQDYFAWVVYRLDPVSVHNVRADSKECCLLPKYRLLQVFTSDKIVYVFLQNNSNTEIATYRRVSKKTNKNVLKFLSVEQIFFMHLIMSNKPHGM